MARAAVIVVSLALAAATTARAQTSPAPSPSERQPADPIGALLQKQAEARGEPEEPDTAAETPQAASRTAPAIRPPSLPSGLSSQAYDQRLRASSASAQGYQGPLDGGWTLSAADGDLYVLQLVDKGRGGLEGAWRDLRKGGGLSGSGFIDDARRSGGDITLRFDGGQATAVLHGGVDGRWTGQLTEAGQTRAVSLKRRN